MLLAPHMARALRSLPPSLSPLLPSLFPVCLLPLLSPPPSLYPLPLSVPSLFSLSPPPLSLSSLSLALPPLLALPLVSPPSLLVPSQSEVKRQLHPSIHPFSSRCPTWRTAAAPPFSSSSCFLRFSTKVGASRRARTVRARLLCCFLRFGRAAGFRFGDRARRSVRVVDVSCC